jgi:hypothetical protein
MWSPRLLGARDDTPEVGYVTIGELHYDYLRWTGDRFEGYQRPLTPDDDKITGMLAEFHPEAVGVIPISRRADGSLWVMDGQRRCYVSAKLGRSVTLAAIYSGLTPDEEADLYYRLNFDRLRPNCWNSFGVRYSRDPVIRAITALVGEYGFRTGSADRSLTSIAAVGALEHIYNYPGGPAILRRTLQWIKDLWPNDVLARDGTFLTGLALFIYNWDPGLGLQRPGQVDEAYDEKRVRAVFSGVPAIEVRRGSRQYRADTGAVLNGRTYATVLRDIYNNRLKSNRIVGAPVVPYRAGSSVTKHRAAPGALRRTA